MTNPAYDVTDQSNRNTLHMLGDLKYEVELDRNPSYGAGIVPEIKKKKDYVVGTEEMIKTYTGPIHHMYQYHAVGDNLFVY